jgi:K+/H+ antiporter YhaU regulatory subunit KhtT
MHTRSVESQRAEAAVVFLLTDEERRALARILQVVEDNWWLDEVERALLERLEASDAAPVLSAA